MCLVFVNNVNVQNAVFCEEKFWKESRIICSSHIQIRQSFLIRVGPQIILLESLPNKQSSRSFSGYKK